MPAPAALLSLVSFSPNSGGEAGSVTVKPNGLKQGTLPVGAENSTEILTENLAGTEESSPFAAILAGLLQPVPMPTPVIPAPTQAPAELSFSAFALQMPPIPTETPAVFTQTPPVMLPTAPVPITDNSIVPLETNTAEIQLQPQEAVLSTPILQMPPVAPEVPVQETAIVPFQPANALVLPASTNPMPQAMNTASVMAEKTVAAAIIAPTKKPALHEKVASPSELQQTITTDDAAVETMLSAPMVDTSVVQPQTTLPVLPQQQPLLEAQAPLSPPTTQLTVAQEPPAFEAPIQVVDAPRLKGRSSLAQETNKVAQPNPPSEPSSTIAVKETILSFFAPTKNEGVISTAPINDLVALPPEKAAEPQVTTQNVGQPQQQAIHLVQTQSHSSVASAVETALSPYTPPAVVEQLAVHLRKMTKDGAEHIKIQLEPAQLGAVEITMTIARDGTVQAVLAADNTDTARWLKQDAAKLEQILQDAGLNMNGGTMQFEDRSQRQAGSFAFLQEQFQDAVDARRMQTAEGTITLGFTTPQTLAAAPDGRLDVHI